MALVLADDVKDTTITAGLANYVVSGTAATGYQSFLAGIGNGNQTILAVRNGADFEVLLGTLSAGTTISRDVILASSNGGAAVNWTAGTKDIFCTMSAKLVVYLAAILTGGDAGKLLKVNAGGTGFDLLTPGAGGGLDADKLDGAHLSALLQLTGGNMAGPINEFSGANIASATTINIGAATGNLFELTGAVTVTGGDTAQNGTIRIFRCSSNPAPLFVHSGTWQMPGQVNYQARQYDTICMRSYGGGIWVCLWITRYDGTPVTLTNASTSVVGGVILNTAAIVDTGTDALKATTAAAILGSKRAVKAAVNFNGTGTLAINNSIGVTSVSDVGTGDYEVNMTSAVPSANHCGLAQGWRSAGSERNALTAIGAALTTTKLPIKTSNSATTATDFEAVTGLVVSAA